MGGLPAGPLAGRWLVPDLATAAAIVTFLYCLFLFEGHWKLFRDSDTGWHIRAGEAMLASRSLPRTDPYSFTRTGSPWYAWEWGADLLMGLAHRWGVAGVALLYGCAIALCTWIWVRLHWAAGGDFLLAAAMTAPFLSTTNLHWMARPHVLSWIFLLGAVGWCERTSRQPARFDARQLFLVAVASAAWANIHASFFMGAGIGLVYSASHLIRPLVWNFSRPAEWRTAGRFLAAAAASLAGSLANPYGWDLHRHIAAYLTDHELMARIGEFQSYNFHSEGSGQILLTVALAMMGGVLAWTQQRPAHFFLAALLVGGALRSARALPLVALVLLPLANGALRQALDEAQRLRPGLRRWLTGARAYSDRLRHLDRDMRGWLWAPAALLLAAVLLRSPGVAARTGFPRDQFPVEAAPQVESLPASARLLAPDKFGGYLIYRFAGRRPVFFDGRSDLYGAEFMKQYGRLMQVRPGWQEIAAPYRFTHALLPNDYSLIPAMQAAGWLERYRDSTATLLERPEAP
ncbi:MAG: hypothetical protein ACKV22_23625 [Bryobacteraceae bacterium]